MDANGRCWVHVFVVLGVSVAPLVMGLYDSEQHLEAARLYGNMQYYAYFFVDLLVGTPPQRVSVIVDTGSSLCAFPCANCDHCGSHLDPLFDFEKSSTASWTGCGSDCASRRRFCSNGHCSYSQSYAEGSSISGFWFQDVLSVGDLLQGNPPVRSFMGCHENEDKLFYTQRANGILGLGPGRGGMPTILEELFRDKPHIQHTIFAICLAEWGGRLVVGGANESYHKGGVQYVPVDVQSGFYRVALESMSVGGLEARGPWGTTIVDSGTTYTYMASENYRPLRDGIESHCRVRPCGVLQKDCWVYVPGGDLSVFPIIHVVLSATTIVWEPRAYLMEFSHSAYSEYCYAFQDDGPHANTVLGISWMLHKDIIFDMNSFRLGVAQADCPIYKQRPAPPEDAASVAVPTVTPTKERREEPTEVPSESTVVPVAVPTRSPTELTPEDAASVAVPTVTPTKERTEEPTEVPSESTVVPVAVPTRSPTELTPEDAASVAVPTVTPTQERTEEPTEVPSESTVGPVAVPTRSPTELTPEDAASVAVPTVTPTKERREEPTEVPSESTVVPVAVPTRSPTLSPTLSPEPDAVPMVEDAVKVYDSGRTSPNATESPDSGGGGGKSVVDQLGDIPVVAAAGAAAAGVCICCLALCLTWRLCLRGTDWDHARLTDADESGLPPEIVGHNANEADADNSETFVICDDIGDEDAWTFDEVEAVGDFGQGLVG